MINSLSEGSVPTDIDQAAHLCITTGSSLSIGSRGFVVDENGEISHFWGVTPDGKGVYVPVQRTENIDFGITKS